MFKFAEILTPLQPHQQRAIDKLHASGGVLAIHGMGSGKTLEYAAAHDSLGLPTDFVVPAPLQANLHKEFLKHTGEPPENARVRSYEKAVRDGGLNTDGLVVFDEAHRGRNPGTGANKLLHEARDAPYRMLGTGTAIYNQPEDVAPLLNTAIGDAALPEGRGFRNHFVGERRIDPSFFQRLRGMKPMYVPELKNRDELIDKATGYVDVHKGGTGPDFPERIDETYEVPMSDKQLDLYRYHEGQMPWYLKAKIRHGLPMSKQEKQELNAFQGALRQTSNTPRPYVSSMTDEEELQHTPKIQKAFDNLQMMRQENPNFRGVVYSNYLGSGLHPYARRLQAAGIPHNLFTGESSPQDRARMIQEYNEGKSPVMLISGAGAEGLDLKGTRAVQVLEPHWNNSRVEQAIARGIRFRSHADLPEDQRNVRVQRYYSVHPKSILQRLGISKTDKALEQYMDESNDQKDAVSREIMKALQEASDRGPLPPPVEKVGYTLPEVLIGSSVLGGLSGAQASPGHRLRGALQGAAMGPVGGMGGMLGVGGAASMAGLPGSGLLGLGGAVAGSIAAPQALRYFNRDEELAPKTAAFQYGEKLAALDPSRLPGGAQYVSPYELKWKTPGGHDMLHPINPHTVDHGIATQGDAYYQQLQDEIAKRNQAADQQAPHDIDFHTQTRRVGNTLSGGMTGLGLGALGGAALGGLAGHFLGNDNSGLGAALGGALGGVAGTAFGGYLGHKTPVKPLSHMSYRQDEDQLEELPGGQINHLYTEDPHVRRMRELQDHLDGLQEDLEYDRHYRHMNGEVDGDRWRGYY